MYLDQLRIRDEITYDIQEEYDFQKTIKGTKESEDIDLNSIYDEIVKVFTIEKLFEYVDESEDFNNLSKEFKDKIVDKIHSEELLDVKYEILAEIIK